MQGPLQYSMGLHTNLSYQQTIFTRFYFIQQASNGVIQQKLRVWSIILGLCDLMVNLLFRGIFFTVSQSVSVAARKLNPVSSFNLQYRFVDPRFMFEYRFRLNKGSIGQNLGYF